jgi:hypothetical protein
MADGGCDVIPEREVGDGLVVSVTNANGSPAAGWGIRTPTGCPTGT